MTIEIFLKMVQDLRSFIEQWGVTAETLIAVAAVASICLIFSMREVLSWYLRVHALREDVKHLREDIAELKALVQQSHLASEMTETKPSPEQIEAVKEFEAVEPKKKDQEKPGKTFPLAH